VDRDVATSGVSTVEELCEACGSTRSVEEKNKEDKKEQDKVPSIAETYEALEKVKTFFYAHSVTDTDLEHILGLEKSCTMYEFFC
jgi:cAMP phosphodiesterase